MRVLINYHGSYTFTLDIQQELTFSLGYLRAHTEPCSQRSSNSLNEGASAFSEAGLLSPEPR